MIPEDWEPLILYWRGNELVRVTVRLHYEWIDYSGSGLDEPHFSLPLKIIFTGSSHGPLVRKVDDAIFDILLRSHKRLKLDYRAIREEDVPHYARTGFFNRRGILVGAGRDIHEREQETLSELDELLGRAD